MLFGVVAVDLVGFGIVLPVLPFYAKQFGASASELGLLMMVYAGAQFAFAPLWGRLSDRLGRRRVMLLTIAGTALSLLALALADRLLWVFAARVLGGAFAANLSVASAYIADVTEEADRTRWMGLLGACFGVGFLLGPAIGGVLAPFGYAMPLFAAAGLAGLNLLHAALALREPPRAAAAATASEPRVTRSSVLRDPLVRRLCLAHLCFSAAVSQLETVFAFFMLDRFGYDAREVAFLLVAMALVMGGIQAGGMRSLAARFGERRLVLGGSALLAAALASIPELPTVAWLLVPLTLAAAGRAVAQPALMSLASLAADPRQRGAVMGAFQSSASLARVFGPVVAGFLYDLALPAPFWLASGLLVVAVGFGMGLPSSEPLPGRGAAEAVR